MGGATETLLKLHFHQAAAHDAADDLLFRIDVASAMAVAGPAVLLGLGEGRHAQVPTWAITFTRSRWCTMTGLSAKGSTATAGITCPSVIVRRAFLPAARSFALR